MIAIKRVFRRLSRAILKRLERPRPNYYHLIYNNPEKLYKHIRKGDVVLVEGTSYMSQIIKVFSQSYWSHIAMYVGDELIQSEQPSREAYLDHYGDEARHMIVEAFAGKGVIASPLSKYIDSNIRLCRPFDIKKKDLQQVIRDVIDNIGNQYDEKNITDIALMLLAPLLPFGRRKYLMTDRIGAGDDYKVICSGMIAQAFQTVRYPVLPGLKKISDNRDGSKKNPYGGSLIMRHYSQILPRDFDLSPNFEIIKFNIIADGKFNYQNLPWETVEERTPEEIKAKIKKAKVSE